MVLCGVVLGNRVMLGGMRCLSCCWAAFDAVEGATPLFVLLLGHAAGPYCLGAMAGAMLLEYGLLRGVLCHPAGACCVSFSWAMLGGVIDCRGSGPGY